MGLVPKCRALECRTSRPEQCFQQTCITYNRQWHCKRLVVRHTIEKLKDKIYKVHLLHSISQIEYVENTHLYYTDSTSYVQIHQTRWLGVCVRPNEAHAVTVSLTWTENQLSFFLLLLLKFSILCRQRKIQKEIDDMPFKAYTCVTATMIWKKLMFVKLCHIARCIKEFECIAETEQSWREKIRTVKMVAAMPALFIRSCTNRVGDIP